MEMAAHLAVKEGAQDDRYEEDCSTSCERPDSAGLPLGRGLVGDTKGSWPEKRGCSGVLCFSIICKLACIHSIVQ